MFPFRVNQYLLAANELERNSLYCLNYLYGINCFLGKDSDERFGSIENSHFSLNG